MSHLNLLINSKQLKRFPEVLSGLRLVQETSHWAEDRKGPRV